MEFIHSGSDRQKDKGRRMTHTRSSLILSGIVLFGLTSQASAQQNQETDPLVMDVFVSQVLERNPALAADTAVLEARQQRVPQVGLLPDPMVGFSLMNIPVSTFRFNQEPMSMRQLTVTQGFPAPGVLRTRTEVAEAGVEIAERQLILAEEQLEQWARNTFLNLYFLDESVAIATENQALLQIFIQNTETRYQTGRGIQQDVLKAQLEHSRLTERLIILAEQRVGMVSRLNALRAMPSDTPIPSLTLPETTSGRLDADALKEAAGRNNPVLEKARAQIHQRQTAVELARRLRRPSWSASTSYAERGAGRRDFITAMVGVQIPVYLGQKQDKAVEEAGSLLAEAEHRLRDLEFQVEATVERLASELRRSRQLMALYADQILPQAEGVLTSVLAGYRVDTVDFLTLIAAQTTLFNYQLASVRVTTDFHKQVADLEAVLGSSLDTLVSGQ